MSSTFRKVRPCSLFPGCGRSSSPPFHSQSARPFKKSRPTESRTIDEELEDTAHSQSSSVWSTPGQVRQTRSPNLPPTIASLGTGSNRISLPSPPQHQRSDSSAYYTAAWGSLMIYQLVQGHCNRDFKTRVAVARLPQTIRPCALQATLGLIDEGRVSRTGDPTRTTYPNLSLLFLL